MREGDGQGGHRNGAAHAPGRHRRASAVPPPPLRGASQARRRRRPRSTVHNRYLPPHTPNTNDTAPVPSGTAGANHSEAGRRRTAVAHTAGRQPRRAARPRCLRCGLCYPPPCLSKPRTLTAPPTSRPACGLATYLCGAPHGPRTEGGAAALAGRATLRPSLRHEHESARQRLSPCSKAAAADDVFGLAHGLACGGLQRGGTPTLGLVAGAMLGLARHPRAHRPTRHARGDAATHAAHRTRRATSPRRATPGPRRRPGAPPRTPTWCASTRSGPMAG